MGPGQLANCTYPTGTIGAWILIFANLENFRAFCWAQFWLYSACAAKMTIPKEIWHFTLWKCFWQLNRPFTIPKQIYRQYDDVKNILRLWRQKNILKNPSLSVIFEKQFLKWPKQLRNKNTFSQSVEGFIREGVLDQNIMVFTQILAFL